VGWLCLVLYGMVYHGTLLHYATRRYLCLALPFLSFFFSPATARHVPATTITQVDRPCPPSPRAWPPCPQHPPGASAPPMKQISGGQQGRHAEQSGGVMQFCEGWGGFTQDGWQGLMPGSAVPEISETPLRLCSHASSASSASASWLYDCHAC
jgi:hypothetical protein